MKKIVKNIFVILDKKEKQKLWLLALADVLISVLDIIFLVALLYVVQFYTQAGYAVPGKKFSLEIFNAHPVLLIVVFFLLFAFKNAIGFIVSKIQYQFVYAVASRISKQLLAQYLDGSYHNYVHIDSSVVNRKISQEPIEFTHYVLNGVQQVFSQLVLVLITVAAVIMFNPLLFPLLVLILAPPVFLISFLMKRKLDAARLHGKETSEKAMQHLQEALSGFVESNLYKKNDFFIRRYHRLQVQLNQYLSERLVIQNMPPRLIESFAVFGLLVLVLVNFIAVRTHTVQLVTIGALMVAAYKIIPGIVKITNTLGQVKTYAFAASGLAANMRVPLKNQEHSNKPIHSISFENICFEYAGKKILASFSLAMEKGDLTVISGISGRGKTTLVNLLLGFLEPSSGEIHVNGNATCIETRQQYWPCIAYAKQQSFFLHGSILENITLQEDAHDDAKLKKITAVTGIDSIINSLASGLATVVTENGKNFSGGQRQRIIFARALYKDADLLVLDEPFNELDEASELEMLNVLQNIAASGKMVILVTHNKAAIAFGNKKIVMDE